MEFTLAASVIASAASWLLARLNTQGQPVETNGPPPAAGGETCTAALVNGEW